MKINFIILLISLNIHIVYLMCDEYCLNCDFDEDDCMKCEDGYYLGKNYGCYPKCKEGLKESDCQFCLSIDLCKSCSDDYEVYDNVNCRRKFSICNGTKIPYCNKCEIVNENETGKCQECVDGFTFRGYDNICLGNSQFIKKKFDFYIIPLIFLFIG